MGRPGQLLQNICAALLLVVSLSPMWSLASAQSAELPTGEDVLHGSPPDFDRSSSNQLTIRQDVARTVIRWDTFDIGEGKKVEFVQPNADAATLNIVSGTTASTLAGELLATGSVYLVNPRGITITPEGKVEVGGTFVASALGLNEDNIQAFMDGSDSLRFEVQPGDPQSSVINRGNITARDVILLGSRVMNDTGATITAGERITVGDTITARLGRVALGSASAVTLDLTGDRFLQVLAPSELALPGSGDVDPLVVNSGEIVAEGGLVQLKAATVREAIRQAIHMPGEVHARSVTGSEGKIVFRGGEGGTVNVNGTVDARPEAGQDGAGGGDIEIDGSKVTLDLSKVRLGEGGRFALASDAIEITSSGNHASADATWITEDQDPMDGRSDIGDLLRAGVDVRLHGYKRVIWDGDLFIYSDQVTAESGKAGDLHLLAGESITLGGTFETYNSNWTLSVNVKPPSSLDLGYDYAYIDMFTGSSGFAEFINNNGHLTLEIVGGEDSAGLFAGSIDLPERFKGESLTARIDPAAPVDATFYGEPYIAIRGDVEAHGDVRLSGNLRTILETSSVATLKGASVIWETETEDRLMGGLLRFIEVRDGQEVLTRFGRGGAYGDADMGGDATRLILGSIATAFTRTYGDANPDQAALDDLVLSLAPHNKLLPGEGARVPEGELKIPVGGIPLSEILADGVIVVSGPAVTAEISDLADEPYYLTLSIDGSRLEEAFKELEYEDLSYYDEELGQWVFDVRWQSGAAGGYWIDLTGTDVDGDGQGDGPGAAGHRTPAALRPVAQSHLRLRQTGAFIEAGRHCERRRGLARRHADQGRRLYRQYHF
ncbi:MAG: filamentous hemagglutinin N-terminal domain-containing protein [Firmicutes bacterium]|nr:filamentous hemagglutinin N-terminal domain-containing protein [Bacillota bacterium]